MYQFTEECKVGIGQIDKEHQYLFSLVNEAEKEINKEEYSEDIILRFLEELQNYTIYHFKHEEEYMERIFDPELPMQRREHSIFIEKVSVLMKEGGAVSREQLRELIDFLGHWLYAHILGSDAMIGKVDRPVDGRNRYELKEFHRVGVSFIDEAHQLLFQDINNLSQLVYGPFERAKKREYMAALKKLYKCAKDGFKEEEKYLEKIKHPDVEAQKCVHEVYLNKIESAGKVMEEMRGSDESLKVSLKIFANYAGSWIENHIQKMDKKIGEI